MFDKPLEGYEYPDPDPLDDDFDGDFDGDSNGGYGGGAGHWGPETDTVDCPACGAEVYEDADCCPLCGEFLTLSSGSGPWQGRSGWWIAAGVAGVVATVFALIASH